MSSESSMRRSHCRCADLAIQEMRDHHAGMAAFIGAPAAGFHAMQHIAGREDSGRAGPHRLVDLRPAGSGIEQDRPAGQGRGLGNPVAGENNGIGVQTSGCRVACRLARAVTAPSRVRISRNRGVLEDFDAAGARQMAERRERHDPVFAADQGAHPQPRFARGPVWRRRRHARCRRRWPISIAADMERRGQPAAASGRW